MVGATQDFVSQGGNSTPSLLTTVIDDSAYMVDSLLLIVPQGTALTLIASKDNYIDVYNDATDGPKYLVTAVTIGDPAPSITGMRLWKLRTDAGNVTASVDMRVITPTGEDQMADDAIDGVKLHDASVTGSKLESIISSVSAIFANITADVKGRITAITSAVNFTSLTNGDLIQYHAGSGKFVNKTVAEVLPVGVTAILTATYDFDAYGGAQGTIPLDDLLPAGAVVQADQVTIEDIDPLTSGGGATVKIGVLTFSTDKLDGLRNYNDPPYTTMNAVDRAIPTEAVFKVGGSAAKVTVTIGTADLTAGKFKIFIPYFIEPIYS